VTSFHRAVHRLVRKIPRGRVATYGQIASMLGAPRAARAVGFAMRRCPADVPWHRVVNASGGISRRPNAAGMLTQRLMLEQEDVPVRRGRIPRLEGHRWAGPRRVATAGASSPTAPAAGGRKERRATRITPRTNSARPTAATGRRTSA